MYAFSLWACVFLSFCSIVRLFLCHTIPKKANNDTLTNGQMNGHCIRVVFHGVYHSPKITGISNKSFLQNAEG